ncbi:hypothetical protein Tco_0454853 [Tanacetum coccineum]
MLPLSFLHLCQRVVSGCSRSFNSTPVVWGWEPSEIDDPLLDLVFAPATCRQQGFRMSGCRLWWPVGGSLAVGLSATGAVLVSGEGRVARGQWVILGPGSMVRERSGGGAGRAGSCRGLCWRGLVEGGVVEGMYGRKFIGLLGLWA